MLFQTIQELKSTCYPDKQPPNYLLFLCISLDTSIGIILYNGFRFMYVFANFFFYFLLVS